MQRKIRFDICCTGGDGAAVQIADGTRVSAEKPSTASTTEVAFSLDHLVGEQKEVFCPMGWSKLAISFWCDGLVRERLDRRRRLT
jgi:hypothetical protein